MIEMQNLLDEKEFDDMVTVQKLALLMAMSGDGYNRVMFCH